MNITLDIILLAVLVISFVIGYKKGFVKSVWKIVALVVTIVLVLALKTPTVNFLAGSALANIAENVNIPQGGGVDIAETLNLPEFIQSDMTNQIDSTNNAVNSINEKTVMWLTNLCLTVIACVALFIIIRLILMAVYMIINGITEAPIIKGVNKFMGGIFATINIIFIIFLLLALVSMFAPAESNLYEMIDKTYAVKYLYNYNILLQLFMKI